MTTTMKEKHFSSAIYSSGIQFQIIRLKTIILTIFLLSVFWGSAQQLDERKFNACIEEVYLNCSENLTPELRSLWLKNYEKVSIQRIARTEKDPYTLLSTVNKKNKCNQSLNYELRNFVVEDFNPLKYQFDYYLNVNQFFRIDNTNYVIVIKTNQ